MTVQLRELQREFHEGDRRWVNLTTASMAGTVTNRTDRNEKFLIDEMWKEVEDRRQQSLHNAIPIRLDMAEQRSQVSRPWDDELRTANQTPQSLAPGTPIAKVFDRVGGKLLVLGNPGAGKTTTMLDLAMTLIQRANADPEEPIPVMMNLSSWKNSQQSLTEWMWTFLKERRIFIPKDLWKTWLKEKKIIPLLDGLDEVPLERQEAAVRTINNWLRSEEGTSRLLVCSRREEYELCASKLDLNGAIYLKPLTNEQLDSYFKSLGMAVLWDTIQNDPDFLELVRTPLLLSVSILANDSMNFQDWNQLENNQDKLNYLLDAYIDRRLNELGNGKENPPEKQSKSQQTKLYLAWLAKQLKSKSEDEFLIENMQPSLLKIWGQEFLYKLINGCLISFVGIILITMPVLIAMISGRVDNEVDVRVSLYVLVIGSLLGLFLSGNADSIEPIENLEFLFSKPASARFSKVFKSKFINEMRSSLVFFGSGLFFLFFLGKSIDLWINTGQAFPSLFAGLTVGLAGLFAGLLMGLPSALLGGLFAGTFSGLQSNIFRRLKPNQGVRQSFKIAVFFFILSCLYWTILPSGYALLASVSKGIINALDSRLILYIFSNLVFVMLFLLGEALLIFLTVRFGAICSRHFALRWVLYKANAIPWNYARFLNHCTERLLLQRVGGRYRFIHLLIQERFAVMPLNE